MVILWHCIRRVHCILLRSYSVRFYCLIYCELTPIYPNARGELVFSYKALGYYVSWFTGYMITFTFIGVAAWEDLALATVIDYLVPTSKAGYLFTAVRFDAYLSWLEILL